MNEELTCKLCVKTFRFQFAREFHFDVVHNYHVYMCQSCEENSENWEVKGFTYTYFELLDHIYKCHEENPYTLLNQLILEPTKKWVGFDPPPHGMRCGTQKICQGGPQKFFSKN